MDITGSILMVKKLFKSLTLIPLFLACLLLDTAQADQLVAKEKEDSPTYILDYLEDSSAREKTDSPYYIYERKEEDAEPTAPLEDRVSKPAKIFFDVYFGNSKTDSDNASASYGEYSFFGGGFSEQETREVSYREASVLGLRLGKWIDDENLGVAVDISYFKADGSNVEVKAYPLSLLMMFRWPLMKNNEYPNGRIYPYVGLGVAFVLADISVDFRPNVRKEISGGAYGFGMDYRLGLAWKIVEDIAIFGEYRNLAADLDLDTSDGFGISFSGETKDAAVDFTTKQLFIGLSFLY